MFSHTMFATYDVFPYDISPYNVFPYDVSPYDIFPYDARPGLKGGEGALVVVVLLELWTMFHFTRFPPYDVSRPHNIPPSHDISPLQHIPSYDTDSIIRHLPHPLQLFPLRRFPPRLSSSSTLPTSLDFYSFVLLPPHNFPLGLSPLRITLFLKFPLLGYFLP